MYFNLLYIFERIKKMKRDLYIELDSILDTRLSTLLNFDFDLGKEWIEKGDYSKRSTDSFKYLSSGVFNILYRERNKATLLNPLPTPMLGMITEYCEKARVEDVSMGGDGLITIHLNTYPYNLSTEELEFILHILEKYRPNYHIAFRIVNKIKEVNNQEDVDNI